MLTNKTIGLIGAGNKAKSIALHLATAQNKLIFFDRNFSKAQALVKQLTDSTTCCDAEAIACMVNCAWEADIIIMAINFKAQQDAAKIIKEVVNQKILVGISEKDTSSLVADDIATLQHQLPNTKLIALSYEAVKAIDANSINITLTSRDETALAAVAAIFNHAGFYANTVTLSSHTNIISLKSAINTLP